MKKIGLTILFLIIALFSFGLLYSYNTSPVIAQISCPAHMDPISDACYQYLQEELNKIKNQQGTIQKKLKEEEYQRLDLQGKINYINTQIAQTEQEIKELQIEIATTDVEINLLQNEINKCEDSISLLKQEINTLSTTVNNRITESYKFSFINQFEIFLDIKNISSVLRRSKYLATTRNKDKEALERHAASVIELGKEEAKLQESKTELEVKKDVREEEKEELATNKAELDKQKAERQTLLAEVKVKEAQLAAQLNALVKQSNEVAAQVQAIAMTLYRTGRIKADTPVTTSTVLGYQGHTGFSYGSHLHLNISGISRGPFELGYFSNSGGRLYDAGAKVPTGNGSRLTQGYHYGYSIDMVGTYTAFNGQQYTVEPGEVCCKGSLAYLGCVTPGKYNLNGEGTAVYPIKPGRATRVLTDNCGGNYVLVDHGNGEVSMYLHLR